MMKFIKFLIFVSILIPCKLAFAQDTSYISLSLDNEKCSQEHSGYEDLPLIDSIDVDRVRAKLREGRSSILESFGENCVIRGVFLGGEISKQTLPTLKFAYEVIELVNGPDRSSTLSTLWLNSGGGLISEAMKIGDYISKKDISTIVMNDGVCLSACVLIFAASDMRGVAGRIGIHRPFAYELSTMDIDHTEYLSAYNEVSRAMRQYLAKYGVSERLVEMMNVTPSDEIKLLAPHELESLGLGFRNIAAQEYEKARRIEVCGKKYYETHRDYSDLIDSCTDLRGIEDYGECSAIARKRFPEYRSMSATCRSLLQEFEQ